LVTFWRHQISCQMDLGEVRQSTNVRKYVDGNFSVFVHVHDGDLLVHRSEAFAFWYEMFPSVRANMTKSKRRNFSNKAPQYIGVYIRDVDVNNGYIRKERERCAPSRFFKLASVIYFIKGSVNLPPAERASLARILLATPASLQDIQDNESAVDDKA